MARKLDELNIAFYKRLKKEHHFNSSLPVLWFFVFDFCLSRFAWKIVLDCLRLSLSEALEDRGNHVRLFEAFLCWKNEGTHENGELHRSELIVEVIFPMTGRPEHLHLPLEMVLQENALTSWIAGQIWQTRMSWRWDHWNINFILSHLLTFATLWTTFPSIDMTAPLPPSLSLPVNSRQIQSDKQDKANASFTRISSELKVFRRHFPHFASDFAVRGSQNRCNMWHDVTDVAVCQAFVGSPLWPN